MESSFTDCEQDSIKCNWCHVILPSKSSSLKQEHLAIHCAQVPIDIKENIRSKASSCPFSGKKYESRSSDPEVHRTNSVRHSLTEGQAPGAYYHEYLQLDKILDAQEMESVKYGKPAHDEHLFIVIHQTYELWFKQILFEIDAVRNLLSLEYVPEKSIGEAVAGLTRVSEIFRVINSQLTILETMTPLGFMDFRDYLFPASGFQSVQFRKIENTLGLLVSQRVSYGKRSYCSYLQPEHAAQCQLSENEKSIHDLIEIWLERTPFLEIGDFSFWKHYADAVKKMQEMDIVYIQSNSTMSEEEKTEIIDEIQTKYRHYAIMYDEEEYNKLKEKGLVRLSLQAMQAALLIMLYQDEPILQTPNKLLMLLFDIDQHLTQWRYRHASMVHRMIGSKMGTGGSSGYNYLRATASQHRIFKDLFQLPTFLISRQEIPPLPDRVKQQMGFHSEL